MEKFKLNIAKVWRSEATLLAGFVLFGIVSVILSRRYPASIISGKLLSWGDLEITLQLPLFWLMPCYILIIGILRIYDVRYIIDSRGLEAKVGILRLNQTITRVLYSDIRSAETDQSLIERLFNVGDVEIGTAATAQIEVIFRGVAAPREVQNIIQRERDKMLEISG